MKSNKKKEKLFIVSLKERIELGFEFISIDYIKFCFATMTSSFLEILASSIIATIKLDCLEISKKKKKKR